MEAEPTPMLFCPPFPPHKLFPGQRVAIGRHSTCDLVIREEDVSRRHAEVFFEDGGFRVRDLGSTNGTFVNGVPIEGEHVLSPGDRIELGVTTITFCAVDGGVAVPEEPSEARTMIAERLPATAEAFTGDLAQVPPDALLQVLEMGRKSGLLELHGTDGVCRLWLDEGAPVHAETAKNVGFDAAMTAVAVRSGRFRFEQGVAAPERTIQASITELLLEASRLEDEAGR